MKENPFKEAKNKIGISMRELSLRTGLSRSSVHAIVVNDKFDSAKLADIIKLADTLNVNLFSFIRKKYKYNSSDIYDEELDMIINRLVEIQMDLIFDELTIYAKLTGYRNDDFDVRAILAKKTNLRLLIALNSRLKTGEISIQDAIRRFPPLKGPFDRRTKK